MADRAPAAAPVAPGLCLSDADMEGLIGTPIAGLQMKWLDERGWPYVLNRRGRPRVARAFFDKRMGVGQVAANDPAAHITEPDWT